MNDSNLRPTLIVFAGPNGSGKSSNTEEVKRICGSYPDLYINADEIALEKGLDAYAAAREAEKRRVEALANNISFSMETVMSSPAKIELMRKAKSLGYHVHLEFVLTQDPALNVMRVQNRVRKGGHDVPAEKIVARYERSVALLPQAMEIADTARILNNSLDNPKVIAKKSMDGKITVLPLPAPSKWNVDNIQELVGIRETPPAGNVTRTVSDPLGWLDTVDGSKLVSEAEKAMRDIEGKGQGPVETQEQDSGTRNDAGEYDFDGSGTNRPG